FHVKRPGGVFLFVLGRKEGVQHQTGVRYFGTESQPHHLVVDVTVTTTTSPTPEEKATHRCQTTFSTTDSWAGAIQHGISWATSSQSISRSQLARLSRWLTCSMNLSRSLWRCCSPAVTV